MNSNYQQITDQTVEFIQKTFSDQQKNKAVIAVSGGIDSAVALTLLTKALGTANITALFLPYGDQSVDDAILITKYLAIPESQVKTINIKSIIDTTAQLLGVPAGETVRMGNLKARARMLCVFDTAKAEESLVCGTENKSEHYLGYFTRFGDAASDIEPISALYKTQIRGLAGFLQLPTIFLEKPPSAGLWNGQTDEEEMGFSYEKADKVLEQMVNVSAEEINLEDVAPEIVKKVADQVKNMEFKRKVPYEM